MAVGNTIRASFNYVSPEIHILGTLSMHKDGLRAHPVRIWKTRSSGDWGQSAYPSLTEVTLTDQVIFMLCFSLVLQAQHSWLGTQLQLDSELSLQVSDFPSVDFSPANFGKGIRIPL